MSFVSWVRVAALVGAAAAVSSCTVERQSAPEISGPSELAQSIALTATPDKLVQDGASQTVINAVARDHQANPIAGLGIRWSVTASDGQAVEPAEVLSVTDAQGRARTIITAPGAPAQLPTTAVRLTVSATPVGGDTASTMARTVVVDLVPPTGTPAANRNPVAALTIIPVVATVNQNATFDGSGTMDEGVPCGSRCSYLWDFGDFATGSGISTTHKYPLPGTYTVTLTVVDERGGVGSASRSLTVTGPAAPVANFVSTPVAPVVGGAVTFNATTSTVGAGATITQYTWDFGDGSAATTTTSPVVAKAYGSAGTFAVTLTVTDSFGRTATRTATITVI
jgi:PKD repeat protein